MAAPHRGSWFGLPDFGITEAIGARLGRPRTSQGGSNIIGGRTPAQTPQSSGQVQGVNTGGFIGPTYPGPVQGPSYAGPAPSSSGGGGGGGGGRLQQLEQIGSNRNPAQETEYRELVDRMRGSARDTNREALNAALGVFESRKQGLLGRIPGIEQQRDLRLRGLDEGLEGFLEASGRQRESLLGQLGERRGEVEQAYTGAARQTRRTAQSLADKLRQQFASRGALDSTQYRDFNIDQSREIAQSIGDIGRERAGKLETIGREESELGRYFAEQETQQRRQVELQKDQARAQTDQLIQGVMADANLTDAQKIEAVAQANDRLASRLGELDQYEMQLRQKEQERQDNLALEVAKLQQKGFSGGFEEQINKNKAIENAMDTLAILSEQLGTAPSAEQAAQTFLSFGLDEDEAQGLASQFFGKTPQRDEVPGIQPSSLATSPQTVTNSPTPFLDRINPLRSATQQQQNTVNRGSTGNLLNNPYFR